MRRISVIKFAILAVISVLGGCSQREKAPDERQLSFNVIETEAVMGAPVNLIISGDTLLVNHYGGNEFMVWLSEKDGSIIKSDIRKGKGTREMLGPLEVDSWDSGLMIFDRPQYKLYESDFMCDSLKADLRELPVWVSQLYPLTGGNLLAVKFLYGQEDTEVTGTRYAVIKKNGDIVNFGKYPDFSKSDKETPADGLAFFHQTNGFCHLPENRFAATTSHVISVYEPYGGTYRLVAEKQIAPYEYTYTPATSTMSATAFLDKGYDRGAGAGLAYHDGKIYVPYREGESEDIVILCYDLDLNPVCKVIPSTPISDPFVIDSSGRLVAIGEDEKSYIAISESSVSELLIP